MASARSATSVLRSPRCAFALSLSVIRHGLLTKGAQIRAYKHRRTLPAPPLVDLEDLCELCEPVDIDAEFSVTQYPMAKEKKKLREEETAVCVLEWESSTAEKGKGGRKVLLVKRPEKGSPFPSTHRSWS